MSEKTQKSDWEDEGGAVAPEPKQKTPKGLEIPVPTREQVFKAFRKVAKSKPPEKR